MVIALEMTHVQRVQSPSARIAAVGRQFVGHGGDGAFGGGGE